MAAAPRLAPQREAAPDGQAQVQRQCATCAEKEHEHEEEEQQVQRRADGATPSDPEPPSPRALAMRGIGGSWSPLPLPEQSHFSRAIGWDFSRVRIHTDALAASSARALRADAFTLKNHVAFAGGRYEPGNPQGRRLLAHELTHVMQQARGLTGPGELSRPGDPLEREADRIANRAAAAPSAAGACSACSAPPAPMKLPAGSPGDSGFMVQRQASREGATAPAPGLQVVQTGVPRPAGLPKDAAFALQPAGPLPPEIEQRAVEGKMVPFELALPPPQIFVLPDAGDQSPFRLGDVTAPLAGTGRGVTTSINLGLSQFGFTAAGPDAIGLVGVPKSGLLGGALDASRVFPNSLAQAFTRWGHTAVYVRQGGTITIVRGFSPESLLALVGNARGVEAGTETVAAAITADASLFTFSGARAIEFPVASELAAAVAGKLPPVGPVAGVGAAARYTARPAVQCIGTNCVTFAVGQAEEALGGPIGSARAGVSVTDVRSGRVVPGTASQGEFIKFTKGVAAGEEALAVPGAIGAPVASTISRGLMVLKWGGRLFFVIGLVSIPVEVALAEKGQGARTAVGASAGFLGGLAAGATAGLVCGPGAVVCSVVLGLAFGIAGALAGRAAAEALYDALLADYTEWKKTLQFMLKNPGTFLAGASATSLAARGGFGGLLRSPADVAAEQRNAAADHRRQQAEALIVKREQDLQAIRRALLGPR